MAQRLGVSAPLAARITGPWRDIIGSPAPRRGPLLAHVAAAHAGAAAEHGRAEPTRTVGGGGLLFRRRTGGGASPPRLHRAHDNTAEGIILPKLEGALA